MADPRRRDAELRGRQAERIAALWLRLKGYSVLDRRVRTPYGEIDLIARQGRVIVFVEVKARPRLADALEAVPPSGWLRISRAAETWRGGRAQFGDHGWRYDLIALAPGHLPVHVRDAWRPGMA
jgi:putative endonuclease